jgi:hypothetical protein
MEEQIPQVGNFSWLKFKDVSDEQMNDIIVHLNDTWFAVNDIDGAFEYIKYRPLNIPWLPFYNGIERNISDAMMLPYSVITYAYYMSIMKDIAMSGWDNWYLKHKDL